MSRLRIAAIDFLNPAPLMYAFEHPPDANALAERYSIEKMTPARCAEQLAAGEADVGLIPIAAYASIPGLAIVPGSTIASLSGIPSLLLIFPASTPIEPGCHSDALDTAMLDDVRAIGSIALDTSSRTTSLYTRILFQKYWYWRRLPTFTPHAPDLDAMLASADAALLIGDAALYALEDRPARQARTGQNLHYLDMADAWHRLTSYPWVSAVWAARSDALTPATSAQLVDDLTLSREQGLAHLPQLAAEWSARLGLPQATVLTYLSSQIHYNLDPTCLAGLHRFYADAAECGLIERVPALRFL